MRSDEIERAASNFAERVLGEYDDFGESPLGAAFRSALSDAFLAGTRLVPPPERVPVIGRPALYARCPGCGNHGDVAHVAACVSMHRDKRDHDAWHRGAWFVLTCVRTQLGRRGVVKFERLVDAAERVYGLGPSWLWSRRQ